MNKDLEIIKNEVKNFGEQSIQTSLDIIVTTAERMAAEGERLNASLNEESIRANVLERCVEERENEIACLKAEPTLGRKRIPKTNLKE